MNEKNLIIIAIFIVIVILLGIFIFAMPHNNGIDGKLNTQINFLNNDKLKSRDSIQFELKDEQGNPLGSQNITINYVEDGNNQTYRIITNNEGKGSLVLNNELPGNREVTVIFSGNIRYNGCSAKQTITIEEGVSDQNNQESTETGTSEPVQSNSTAGTALYNTGNTSSQEQLYYDSQYNFYYDQNGIIRGGQNDGYSADYIRDIYENQMMVDENGNLV